MRSNLKGGRMTTNRRFSSALPELDTDNSTTPSAGKPLPMAPALSDVLAQIGAIPTEALFLGIASDGLPVLLNLYDAHPGPLLIVGDDSSGKTAFLQTMAQAAAQTHRPADLQFGVVTSYPEEWESTQGISHRVGVFPIGHPSTPEFIRSLTAWAHSNKNTQQCMLLLIDDLESLANLELEAVQDFRWLLLRGTARRVWPIVTMNAPRHGQVISWLQNFRTRIFGHIANGQVAEALGADKVAALNQLEPRIQFSLREKDQRSGAISATENWLRFWLPSC
jgi:DNA translocase FtsK/SpoIIIE-like protein